MIPSSPRRIPNHLYEIRNYRCLSLYRCGHSAGWWGEGRWILFWPRRNRQLHACHQEQVNRLLLTVGSLALLCGCSSEIVQLKTSPICPTLSGSDIFMDTYRDEAKKEIRVSIIKDCPGYSIHVERFERISHL